MSLIEIHFFFEERKVRSIKCSQDLSINEFISEVKDQHEDLSLQSNLDEIQFAYLKGHKLEGKDLLRNHLDDLLKCPIFLSNDPKKSYEYNIPHININFDDYENIEFYSEVSTGYLLKAIDKKTKKEVLIKVYRQDNHSIEFVYLDLRSYNIVSKVNHPATIKILGFRYPLTEQEKNQTKLVNIKVERKNGNSCDIDVTYYIAVLEFYKENVETEVNKYLRTKGGENDKMNPTIRSKIIFGIASAMKRIHEKKAIHCNLKLNDIFLDDKLEPRVGGFDYAAFEGSDFLIYIGNPFFHAPETYIGEEDEPYTSQIDVYSYAFILYKMFTSKVVFPDKKANRGGPRLIMQISIGMRPLKPENIPEHYWELIQTCWKNNPEERLSFKEIVELLKDDKFALEEFGMKTNLDELHEYQKRIESSDNTETTSSINQPENFFIGEEEEKYHKVVSKIGEGATSITYKVIDTRTDNVMCKKILKIISNNESKFKTLQNAIKEFEILYNLDHECICKAIGINTAELVTDSNINSNEENENEVTTVAIFLEFIEYSLSECLKTMNNTLKTRIVIEIAHAMNYIHKKGLIHRDLKIENIRLNSVYEAKIIDFGLVRIHECLNDDYSFVQDSMTKGVGTLAYMSPEMLNEEKYDYKTDVYSFGVVLYFIFIGSLPKISLKDKMAGKKVQLPEPSSSISKNCIEIISKCLSYDPHKRPSFKEILDIIRKCSYSLANQIDQKVVSRRDKELQTLDN